MDFKRVLEIVFLFLIILGTVMVVRADPVYDMCKLPTLLNSNCTIVTPSLVCSSYYYKVLNVSDGSILESNDLAFLNEGSYYFNFTEGIGDYQLVLCDNSTMTVSVVDGDGGMDFFAALMIVPMILGIMLLFASWFLSDEHNGFKVFLFLLSFLCYGISLYYGLVGSSLYFTNPSVQTAISTSLIIFGVVYVFMIFYWIIFFIKQLFDMAFEKKHKRELEMRL